MKFLTLIFVFLATHLFSMENSLAICAIFHNDARFLDEWVQFHLNEGVSKIYLYNNNSDDEYPKVLHKYIKAKKVILKQWNYTHDTASEWYEVQCNAYMDCIRRVKGRIKWVACIDTDEFLFSPTGMKVVDVLRDYEDCDAVGVNWIMYGTSNVERLEPGEKLTDHMVWRSEISDPENMQIKTIVRPEKAASCYCPHYFVMTPGSQAVNEKKQPIDGAFTPNSVSNLRINHYWTRDKHFFFTEKRVRRKKLELVEWETETLLERDKNMCLIYDPILSTIYD